MDIKIGMQNDVIIVRLIGNLVASTAENFKKEIDKLLQKNFFRVIVDLSKVDFMDSSGLGACMNSHKLITEKDGALVFVGAKEPVMKIFRITKADQKLNIAATEVEGLMRTQPGMKK